MPNLKFKDTKMSNSEYGIEVCIVCSDVHNIKAFVCTWGEGGA